MKREELLRYCGNLGQVAGIDKVVYTEGKSKGVNAYQVKTGSGFCFTSLPDKCLDVSQASYKGMNLSFLFKGGVIAPEFFYPVEDGFLSNISCGMFFTGGLRNAGGGNRDDDGRFYPTHGRISQTPARNSYARCWWEGDDYLMELGGQMTEGTLFGEQLVLNRTIKTKLGAKEFEICDVVENQSALPDEFMLLYHMNLGYPYLDEDAKIYIESNSYQGMSERAEERRALAGSFGKPVDGGGEDCYLYDPKTDAEGWVTVRVENPKHGFGIRYRFKKETLPYLIEWRSCQSTDYALGIEPSNSRIMGRKAERENGTLKKIAPFEKVSHTVIFGVYDL